MPKTDKELTIELVTTYLHVYGANSSTPFLNASNIMAITENFYHTVSNLGLAKTVKAPQGD